MTHYMKLNPEPFDKIASGKKTIELRLYDKKRKTVLPGDEIIFTHIHNPYRSISVIVDSVITAASFESLFKHISLVDCGYEEKEITGSNHLDMNQYYSEEKQRQYGVVGIRFSTNTKRSLSEVHVPYDEIEASLTKSVAMSVKRTPEVIEWYSWFKSIDRAAIFPDAYKKAIGANTLESAIEFLDTVIMSYIFDQSMELRDKFCEENGYNGTEDIRKFLYRYYDGTNRIEEYFPLKPWWESTLSSIIYYFCGMTAFYIRRCQYYTVFDGVDEDGDWYFAL